MQAAGAWRQGVPAGDQAARSDQPNTDTEMGSIMCRICEECVPTRFVQDHSRVCAVADRCDQKGLSVDERLIRVAETLEKMAESYSQIEFPNTSGSPDVADISNPSINEESLGPDLKHLDWSRRGSADKLDNLQESDNINSLDEIKNLPLVKCDTHFEPTSDQGTAASSAGSLTPRSPLTTPRSNHVDMLLAGKSEINESTDLPQIVKLADIARCISNTSHSEESSLSKLVTCIEDLQEIMDSRKHEAVTVQTFGSRIVKLHRTFHIVKLADIARCISNTSHSEESSLSKLVTCIEDLQEIMDSRKHEAVTVQTFGSRIVKLHREKYMQLYDLVDMNKADSAITITNGQDDVVRSLQANLACPVKDHTSIDDFQLIKSIRRCASGHIFLAKKRTTGDLFAIKVIRKADIIRKNAVESLLSERDILITVRNPFVVRLFYSFTSRENLYLVMEYLKGGNLSSLLRNLGCLDEDVARVYLAEVVLALEYLHSMQIVHGNLKPDNLFISHDGHIKLAEFGLSKVVLINSTDDLSDPAVSGVSLHGYGEPQMSEPQQINHQTLRQNRPAVGTPDYLAPEILLGAGDGKFWTTSFSGTSADWWSVGVILFELIVGVPPFTADDPQTIFDKILNHNIRWPHVPEKMSFEAHDLIDKLLEEDPHQRLGAKGASEVKQHPFFKDISWDTLGMQKASFVPNSDGTFDTGHSWNTSNETQSEAYEFEDSSDYGNLSRSNLSATNQDGKGVDCSCFKAFESGSDVCYSFRNFSFKNLSTLASINYELLAKELKDASAKSETYQSM